MKELQMQALLQSDSAEDFKQLYKKFSAALFGILLKIVHDEDIAKDVLQDAFIKIWANRYKYDSSRGTIFTWMLNVTRNQAIDYLRSKQHSVKSQSISVDNFVGVLQDGLGSFKPDFSGDSTADLLKGLDPELNNLMTMVYIQGYTQQEVSDQTGVPLGTIKSRIRLAVQKIRKHLQVFNNI